MDRRVKISTVGALFAALTGSTLAATPAFALEPKPAYVVSTNSAATVNQILASGDTVGKSAMWQGIPDGMGAVKNPNGTVSVFVNHELATSDPFVAATERAYGGYGTTISKVTTNSAGTAVTKIEDAIKKVSFYDYQEGVHGSDAVAPDGAPDTDQYGSPNHTINMNRFCAATLVPVAALSAYRAEFQAKQVTSKRKATGRYVIEVDGKTQTVTGTQMKEVTQTLYKNAKGKWTTKKVKNRVYYGTREPIFITGEEGGDESRIFALNTRTGELAQLPALGLGAVENASVAGENSKTTVAMIGEDGDAIDSQLFMYKGTKTRTGTWYERAGFTNGKNHVANITSLVNQAVKLPSGVDVAANAAITNDVIARATLDRKNVSSIVRGNRAITSTSFKIESGVATVTAANSFIAGEVVAIAGLSTNSAAGLDAKAVTLLSASATAYTFATDGIDEASAANASIVATPAANSTLVTTATAHNLVEGDKVSIRSNGTIGGTYVVTGVPSSTKFTYESAEVAPENFTGFAQVNRVLNVEFNSINTNQSGKAQAAAARDLGTEFARVEDGHFNPKNVHEYFFVTTQSDSDGNLATNNSKATSGTGWTGNAGNVTSGSTTSTGATVNSPAVKASGRDGGALWKLTFENVYKPELGATLDLVLDGSEAPTNDSSFKLNKLDNLTISDDGSVAFLQEDPGGNDQIARLLAVRLADRKLVSVATFNGTMFSPNNASNQMTNDEETSGIFDATKLFGGSAQTYIFNAQVHPVSTLGGLNSSSNGSSFSSDPQKAAATALLRPDLRTKAVEVSVKGVSVSGSENTSGSGSSTTYSRRMTLTVDSTDKIAANDIINVVGLTRAHNGVYSVRSVDTTAKTVTVDLYSGKTAAAGATGGVSATAYSNPAIVGTARLFVSNADEDLAIKTAIIEGGGLYTLKITSLSALFN
jgi:hypothetical protein